MKERTSPNRLVPDKLIRVRDITRSCMLQLEVHVMFEKQISPETRQKCLAVEVRVAGPLENTKDDVLPPETQTRGDLSSFIVGQLFKHRVYKRGAKVGHIVFSDNPRKLTLESNGTPVSEFFSYKGEYQRNKKKVRS